MTDSNILVALQSEVKKGTLAHEDANGLFDRSRRFLSLELPEYIDEEQMQKFTISQGILEGEIEWHIEDKALERTSSFPVLKKNGEIFDATECSKLLVTPFAVSWVYIKSSHAEALREFIAASKREMGVSTV